MGSIRFWKEYRKGDLFVLSYARLRLSFLGSIDCAGQIGGACIPNTLLSGSLLKYESTASV